MTYEYKYLDCSKIRTREDLIKVLNKEGKLGWRLITHLEEYIPMTLLLERPAK